MSSKTLTTKSDDAKGGIVPKTAILTVFSVTGIPGNGFVEIDRPANRMIPTRRLATGHLNQSVGRQTEIEVSDGVSVADILDHGADQPILAG